MSQPVPIPGTGRRGFSVVNESASVAIVKSRNGTPVQRFDGKSAFKRGLAWAEIASFGYFAGLAEVEQTISDLLEALTAMVEASRESDPTALAMRIDRARITAEAAIAKAKPPKAEGGKA